MKRSLFRTSHGRDGERRLARARHGLLLLLCGLVALATSACGSDDDAAGGESATVRVALVPSTPWLPAMVADHNGYFADNGLDVELTKVERSPGAAIGRQFEIGQATGTDFSQAVNGGIDQVLISNVAQEGEATTAIMVPADSGIESAADLAGKRVGVGSRASVIAQSILYLVKQAGGDPSTVTLQEMPFPTMADQLAAGRVDAVAAVEPFATQAERAGAVRLENPIVAAGTEAGGSSDIPVLFAASSREWADAHPDEIDAWRKSLAQGAEYIKTNEAEARKILQEFAGLPAEVAEATPLFPHETGAVGPEQIELWINVLTASGTLPADADLDPTKLVAK